MVKKSDFKVFKSPIGLGLKTLLDIKKGDEILEYTGRRVPNEKANEKPNRYLFELDDKVTIDGSSHKNLARYINHACKPNAEAVHYTDENRIYIEALRNIKTGEEITFDYGEQHFDEYIKPKGCRCATCQK